jgi:signal transduction histidine kinase
MVVFRVSDAGQGVPESFIPRLFERYSQGPDHAPGGSGLGLSVARDLVRAHHGTVRYDLTEPAFIVTLPAAPTEIRTPNGRVISPPRRMGKKQHEYDAV